MSDWTRVRCSNCSGHGIVSDYRSGDFDGPMECSECNGSGFIWRHKSGCYAAYPGGPFRGREPVAKAVAA